MKAGRIQVAYRHRLEDVDAIGNEADFQLVDRLPRSRPFGEPPHEYDARCVFFDQSGNRFRISKSRVVAFECRSSTVSRTVGSGRCATQVFDVVVDLVAEQAPHGRVGLYGQWGSGTRRNPFPNNWRAARGRARRIAFDHQQTINPGRSHPNGDRRVGVRRPGDPARQHRQKSRAFADGDHFSPFRPASLRGQEPVVRLCRRYRSRASYLDVTADHP